MAAGASSRAPALPRAGCLVWLSRPHGQPRAPGLVVVAAGASHGGPGPWPALWSLAGLPGPVGAPPGLAAQCGHLWRRPVPDRRPGPQRRGPTGALAATAPWHAPGRGRGHHPGGAAHGPGVCLAGAELGPGRPRAAGRGGGAPGGWRRRLAVHPPDCPGQAGAGPGTAAGPPAAEGADPPVARRALRHGPAALLAATWAPAPGNNPGVPGLAAGGNPAARPLYRHG